MLLLFTTKHYLQFRQHLAKHYKDSYFVSPYLLNKSAVVCCPNAIIIRHTYNKTGLHHSQYMQKKHIKTTTHYKRAQPTTVYLSIVDSAFYLTHSGYLCSNQHHFMTIHKYIHFNGPRTFYGLPIQKLYRQPSKSRQHIYEYSPNCL